MNPQESDITQINLHHDRKTLSHTVPYVEFYFYGGFYELFNLEGHESRLEGNEITGILELLKISADISFLKERYEDQGNHDVEVFHSDGDEMTFAYFDFEKDPTDQMYMFFFGISCTKQIEDLVLEKLLAVYRKLGTSSPFSYDLRNNSLYLKTFMSYHYFYEGKYQEAKRKLNHHNLENLR